MIKRNSIVTTKKDRESGNWSPFYRVIRVRGDQATVVSVMRDYETVAISDLEEHDYKGRWDRHYLKSYWALTDIANEEDHVFYVWIRMPSLRKMKQRASRYHPEIFKKNRKRK